MATESSPPAPAVVAVVVTCDPGPWFEETLTSLAAQDYPNLSVLVIDAGSSVDITAAVAAVMPGAFVRRLERRVGFGTAANEVLEIVEGASHFLFCHDDVALAPDALGLMVEEAFRSNVGVASPKYVEWDAPDRLLAVGLTTDKVGARRNLVDRGELDQEQHDSVREILIAPGGVTLVRADLFTALGGYDPVVDHDGEDMDLSWRARLFGARITAVPAARVRHLEATRNGQRRRGRRGTRADSDGVPADENRNRYRTLLTCYRWYTLAWIVPLAVVWGLGEAVTLLLQGRLADSRKVVSALTGALRPAGQLRRARSRVQHNRHIGDGELRSLQVRGNARLRGFVQSRVDDVRSGLQQQGLAARPLAMDPDGPEPDADGRAVAPIERPSRRRNLNGLLLTLLLIGFVVGTRSLFGRPLGQIGTLPNTSGGWATIWRSWWSAWQPGGLGAPGAGSPAMALLGLLDTVLFGAAGTLEHVVVLAPLVLGPLGAYRGARLWGSRRGQVIATVTYALVPLPYNALAGGHWDGLVAYGATPWVLSILFRLSSVVPVPTSRLDRIAVRVVGLAVLIAVVASVGPSYMYVVPLMGAGLLAGSLLTGRALNSLRLLAVSAVATVIAFLLLLPWSATVIATRATISGPGLGAAGRLGLGQILRFHTGPFGSGWWEWLILIAAALPLLVGREWRLEWAARLWVMALVCFAVAWAGRRGWVTPLPLDVVLAPAAAALAGSAALGVAAFEQDLPGYNFGWRQAAAGLAGLALAVSSLPWFAAVGGGRWNLPSADATGPLAFLPSSQAGDYRVLWVGAPDSLPMAGRELEPGFAYGTTFDGEPSLADAWASGAAGAAPQLAADLLLVQKGLTTKLGHLLAPAGIHYLVIPNHVGANGGGGPAVAVPDAIMSGLALQTDLQTLQVSDPNYTVFENTAWSPVRSVLPTGAAQAAASGGVEGIRRLQETDLTGSAPVLTGGTSSGSSGPVPTGQQVIFGSTRDSGWHLAAGGRSIGARPAFGWAMSFQTPAAADPTAAARLTYSAPFLVRAGYFIEIILWTAAAVVLVLDRRRRAGADESEEVDADWFAPMSPAPSARSERRSGPARSSGPPRRTRPGPIRATGSGRGPEAPDDEEMWTDV
ncbi:MAG TPA: glycosyltransferase [Acidimicrobiales bacterium]|nr:glycosyltransferase [Acidimicrobiales bacterium]